MKRRQKLLAERLYLISNPSEMKIKENETPLVGRAYYFDTKEKELWVEFEDSSLGIIPESEITIYDFSYPEKGKIPYEISRLIGHKVRAIVTQKLEDDFFILSRKKLMAEAWESLEVGSTTTAVVTALYDYGIFIDVGCGIPSFIPARKCSATQYFDLGKWFSVGDKTQVKILQKSSDYKIEVSRKDAYPSLEDMVSAISKYDIITVKIGVSENLSGGYFCEVTPGVTGIIDTNSMLNEGEIVRGRVKRIAPHGVKLYQV